MINITQTYNTIYDSTYYICAQTPQSYLLFFRDLVQKYLSDAKNYKIIVSTTDKLLPMYQNSWPNNERLTYENNIFIPDSIPNNINIIYFYHQKSKPSIENQMKLVEFLEQRPNVKYIYVGNPKDLIAFVRFKLFKHYLHFAVIKNRWCRLRTGGIISWKYSNCIGKKYRSQFDREKKATTKITLWDYYILHDTQIEKTIIGCFNQRIFKPKKKPVPKPVVNNVVVNQNPPKPKIQYIYTQPKNTNFLIMPDGSKENYKSVVSKYLDIIEI